MHHKIIQFNTTQRTKDTLDVRSGDFIKVHRKIQEGEKTRIQVFEGLVIAKKGGQSASPVITVRKSSFGVGVELILPLYSPSIEKIEIVKRTKTRRAKLYFVRDKSEKELRKKLKEVPVKKVATTPAKKEVSKKTETPKAEKKEAKQKTEEKK